MSQTPVTGIRMDPAMATRFARAVAASESQKPADVHRALLNLGLHAVEAENYNFDFALLRTLTGRSAEAVMSMVAHSPSALSSVEGSAEKEA